VARDDGGVDRHDLALFHDHLFARAQVVGVGVDDVLPDDAVAHDGEVLADEVPLDVDGVSRAIAGWAGSDRAFLRLTHDVQRRADLHAPVARLGRNIAVRGSIALLPVLLGLAVLFWTAGFDVIYALQDESHDRAAGLRSIPARFGARTALWISAGLHAAMVILLLAVWRLAGGGAVFLAGIAATLAALVYQHAIVRPGDLSRVDAAFFTANGFVSVTLAACGIAQVLMRG